MSTSTSKRRIICPFCGFQEEFYEQELILQCSQCAKKFLLENDQVNLDKIAEFLKSSPSFSLSEFAKPKEEEEEEEENSIEKAQTKKLKIPPQKVEEDYSNYSEILPNHLETSLEEALKDSVPSQNDIETKKLEIIHHPTSTPFPSTEESPMPTTADIKKLKLALEKNIAQKRAKKYVVCPSCNFKFASVPNALIVCCIQCLNRFVPNFKQNRATVTQQMSKNPPVSLEEKEEVILTPIKTTSFQNRFEAMIDYLTNSPEVSKCFINQEQLQGEFFVGQILFKIEKKIAEGGMGSIYRARMICGDGFEKTVALKTLRPKLAKEQKALNMFISEARVMASLKHHNIAAIHSFGKFKGLYFYAMEYIEGRDLQSFILRHQKTHSTAPIGILVYIIAQVCNALNYIHTKKDNRGKPLELIHRDISPQNIMFSADGVVKVMDFGVAKGKSIATSKRKALAGKLNYTAPEIALFQEVDHRADIYSLGVVFYELISGKRPFQWNNPVEMNQNIEKAEFELPSKYRKIPEDLEKIILRAMAKEPNQRWADAATMAFALNRFLYSRGMLFNEQTLADFLKKVFRGLGKSIATSQREDWVDLELARQAIQQNMVSREQLMNCLKEQAEFSCRGEYANLGALFVHHNHISIQQFQSLLQEQNIEVMQCPSCSNQYYVKSSQTSMNNDCQRCATYLKIPKNLESALVDGQLLDYTL